MAIILPVIICLIIGFIYGLITEKDFVDGGLIGALCGMFCGIVLGAILTISLGIFIEIADIDTVPVVVETYEVQALKDNYSVEGYLLRRVDEDIEYTFLYNESGKGLTTKTIDADCSYIKALNGNEAPRVELIEYHYKNKMLDFLMVGWIATEYYIYLPEDSIVNEYEVDLE